MTDDIIDRAFVAARAAIAKVAADEPHQEVCVFCGQPLVVQGLPAGGPYTQWLIHCPCGKSNATFKGL